jgi:hypothetical protein
LNVATAVYLSIRLVAFLQPQLSHAGVLMVLTAYPLALTFFLGQIQIFMAWAVCESYIALRRSEDLRGGVWLGVLSLKPQYLALIVPILLWHRRWRTLGGMAVMGTVIWGGSFAIAGPQSLLRYAEAVGSMSEFRSDWPQTMVNWRSVVLFLRPGIGDPAGNVLTALLSILMAASTIVLWRTGWKEGWVDFPAKMTTLWIATILTSYHSHAYGAAILVAPLAETWTTPSASRPFKLLLLIGAYVPTLILCTDYPVPFATRSLFSRLPPAALISVVALILMYLVLWSTLMARPRKRAVASHP